MATGWADRYVQGQVESIHGGMGNADFAIYVCESDDALRGYITVALSRWNMLGRIHGLVVHPRYRRQGHAYALVAVAEAFLQGQHARGLYVDTPVDNLAGRALYTALGYQEDHVMSRYYADDLDGVTFAKFFGGR
jgi:ribosomal protein S18 acetylase RimI-like enzyme